MFPVDPNQPKKQPTSPAEIRRAANDGTGAHDTRPLVLREATIQAEANRGIEQIEEFLLDK